MGKKPGPILRKLLSMAEEAVEHAQGLDVELDYSLESLAEADEILSGLGAYIGEALHQFAGAEWRSDGPGDFHLEYQGSVIWSLDKAHDRIVNGDEDNVLHYAAVMLRRWCSEAGRSQFLVE